MMILCLGTRSHTPRLRRRAKSAGAPVGPANGYDLCHFVWSLHTFALASPTFVFTDPSRSPSLPSNPLAQTQAADDAGTKPSMVASKKKKLEEALFLAAHLASQIGYSMSAAVFAPDEQATLHMTICASRVGDPIVDDPVRGMGRLLKPTSTSYLTFRSNELDAKYRAAQAILDPVAKKNALSSHKRATDKCYRAAQEKAELASIVFAAFGYVRQPQRLLRVAAAPVAAAAAAAAAAPKKPFFLDTPLPGGVEDGGGEAVFQSVWRRVWGPCAGLTSLHLLELRQIVSMLLQLYESGQLFGACVKFAVFAATQFVLLFVLFLQPFLITFLYFGSLRPRACG